AVERLSRASRWLNYYCWHMTTLTLVVMAAMFAWSAVEPTARGFGGLFPTMAAAFSVLCIAVALKGGVRPYRFPPTGLFAAGAAAGLWGVLALKKRRGKTRG